jgi:hypothetical protein
VKKASAAFARLNLPSAMAFKCVPPYDMAIKMRANKPPRFPRKQSRRRGIKSGSWKYNQLKRQRREALSYGASCNFAAAGYCNTH